MFVSNSGERKCGVLEWEGAVADGHTLYLERKKKGKNYSNLSGV